MPERKPCFGGRRIRNVVVIAGGWLAGVPQYYNHSAKPGVRVTAVIDGMVDPTGSPTQSQPKAVNHFEGAQRILEGLSQHQMPLSEDLTLALIFSELHNQCFLVTRWKLGSDCSCFWEEAAPVAKPFGQAMATVNNFKQLPIQRSYSASQELL